MKINIFVPKTQSKIIKRRDYFVKMSFRKDLELFSYEKKLGVKGII
jgi:hypothetical protein